MGELWRVKWFVANQRTRQECTTKLKIAPSPTSKHRTQCRPYCSKCFYETYCRWWGQQGQRQARHKNECPLSAKQTDVEMRQGLGTEHIRELCRMCASLTQAERNEEFEARDKTELDRLARLPLACSRCRTILPAKGPRWWICQPCLTECPSHLHPPWAAT